VFLVETGESPTRPETRADFLCSLRFELGRAARVVRGFRLNLPPQAPFLPQKTWRPWNTPFGAIYLSNYWRRRSIVSIILRVYFWSLDYAGCL
jgi:hypothetical protein